MNEKIDKQSIDIYSIIWVIGVILGTIAIPIFLIPWFVFAIIICIVTIIAFFLCFYFKEENSMKYMKGGIKEEIK